MKLLKLFTLLTASCAWANDYTVSTSGTMFDRGTALQSAINGADCGDRVIVPAGYVYSLPDAIESSFTLPYKNTANCNSGSLWVDIQSDRLASLPDGVRVGPASVSLMPTLSAYRGTLFVVKAAWNANHYRLRGLYITADVNVINHSEEASSLIGADSGGTLPANYADNIVVDRCVLTPGVEASTSPFRTTSFGVNMAGTNWVVKNSYLYNFEGMHSQAPPTSITAATNASPAAFTSAHGQGASGVFWTWVDGATGSWAKLNGFIQMTIVDANTIIPSRWMGTITKTTGIATVATLFNRAHNLSPGDSIYIGGITDVAGTSLNGTKTVVSTPNAYTLTYADSSAANNVYCSYNASGNYSSCASQNNDNITLSVDSRTFGALSGTVRWRGESPLNSYAAAIDASPGPYRLINNYMDGWFSAFFTGGGHIAPGYTATMTGVSAGGATFSSVSGLRVKELVSFLTPYTGYKEGWQTVQIQSIVGNVVTWKGVGPTRLANAASDYDSGTCTTSGTAVTLIGFGAVPPNPYTVFYSGVPITINGVDYVISSYSDGTHITLTGSAGTQTGVACHLSMMPVEGGTAGWRGSPGPILEVRGNSFYKSSTGLANNRVCKAMHEMKLWNGGIIDGNTYSGYPCITMAFTMHNQNGDAPWSSFRNWTYSNNLALNTGNTAIIDAMNDYLATVVQASDLPGDFEYGNKGGSVFNNIFLDDQNTTYPSAGYTIGDDASVWTHNTQKRYEPLSQAGVATGDVKTPCSYNSALPPHCIDSTFKDNVNTLGHYGISGVNWPNFATQYVHNILVDDWGVGYPPANNSTVANWGALGPLGTCNATGSNWLNCVATSYAGTASDGGTPGADVKQINDHINMWSEKAGLIAFTVSKAGGGYQNAAGAFSSTGLTESITWTRVNNSDHGTCAMHLFTDLSRTVEHADTTGGSNYDCTRAGNTNAGQSTTFVLGTHASLTPMTTYYYEITDGSNLMTGAFSTGAQTNPGGTSFSGAVTTGGKVVTQ